jgi:hypothetical protein
MIMVMMRDDDDLDDTKKTKYKRCFFYDSWAPIVCNKIEMLFTFFLIGVVTDKL